MIHLGPTTVLCFLSNTLLLSGKGRFLILHDLEQMSDSEPFQIFPETRIHGVHVTKRQDHTYLLHVYGQKWLAIVELKIKEHIKWTIQSIEQQKDWIFDILPWNQHLVLAYMHNAIEIQGDTTVICPVRCINYSSRLFNHPKLGLIVASGTVFQQIILWSPLNKTLEGHGTIIKTLHGHSGVIFNLRFNETGNLLASCSDDRTIRLWNVEGEQCDPIQIFYGHMARVWDCLLFSDRLITISEDSSSRLWDINTGQSLAIWKGHSGKNLWSVALNTETGLVATGGSDGTLRFWNSQSEYLEPIQSLLNVPLEQNERTRMFQWTGLNQMLLWTTKGRILSYNHGCIENCHAMDYVCEMKCPEIQVAGHLTVCSCVIQDQVYLLLMNGHSVKTFTLSEHEGKIMYLKVCLAKSHVHCVFVTTKETMHVYKFDLSTHQWSYPVTCSLPKHFKVNAALISESIVVLGSTSGTIAVFERDTLSLTHSINAHGQEIITCILNEKENLYSVGGDGVINTFALSTMTQLSSEKVTKGRLEKIYSYNNELFVTGFYSRKLFLYNVKEKSTVFQFDCGGGNREWSLQLFKEQVQFGYMQQTKIEIVTSRLGNGLTRNPSLGVPFHGNETRALHVHFDSESKRDWVFTGGEDTLVRIYMTYPLDSFIPLRGHRSAIRCFWSCEIDNRILLFSGGARDELFVWKQDQASFSLVSKNPFRQEAYECRIMALSGHTSNNKIYVFVGYSDGHIRLFEYQDQLWTLIHSTDYHRHCLLSIKCVLMGEKVFLMAGATDGRVSVWENPFSGFMNPIICHQHQSGVNGLDATILGCTLIIATGGDDNAVTVQYLDLSQRQLKERYHITNAHAAPITGIQIVNKVICSISVDQILACWTLQLDPIQRIPTDIPDAGAIHRLCDDSVLIVGIGMQQLKSVQ